MGWRAAFRVPGRDAVLGLLVLLVVGACSSAPVDPAPAPATVTPPSVTPTPTAADRGAPALAAYRGMWQDFVEAGRASDWQSPNLGRHAIGIALTNLSRSLYADHYNGLITKGQPVLNPSVESIEPTNAPTKVVVSDCADSTGWLKSRASSGKQVGGGGGRSRITGVVEKQADGSWKVSDYAVQDIGSC